MSIAAIKAGSAFYEISAKDQTDKGLASAEARLKQFGARIGTIGAAMGGLAAAGLTAIGAMVKSFAGAGDNLSDAMGQTGMGSDFLQTLKFGAADAGVGFDQLLGSVNKFQSLITDAAGGSESANKTLAKLGLTIDDLAGLSPDQQFSKMADAIAGIKDPAARAAAAIDVFGKSGARMLPMLMEGADGLAKSMEDLKSRKMIMSPADIELAQKAEGAFLNLGLGFSRIVELIGAAVTPAFLDMASVVQTVVDSVVLFLDSNRELVANIAKALVVVGAIGGVLMVVGGAAMMAGAALTGIAAIGATIGAVFAVIASPVFLIGAAIAACGAAALTAAFYLDKLFFSGAGLNFLKDAAMGAWEAIKLLWTAVSNGQWGLAGQLIGDALAVGFSAAMIGIKQAWNSTVIYMTNLLVKAVEQMGIELEWLTGLELFDMSRINKIAAGIKGGVGFDTKADEAKMTARLAQLAKTAAEIRGFESPAVAAGKGKGLAWAGHDYPLPNPVRAIQQAMFGESVGAQGSPAAALLGRAAPANTFQEKQLDLQAEANKKLDRIANGVENLEGLTAD